MAPQSSQIKEQIERQREALGHNLGVLEDRVKQATDWRARFREEPTRLLGYAFGAGLFLALLTRR